MPRAQPISMPGSSGGGGTNKSVPGSSSSGGSSAGLAAARSPASASPRGLAAPSSGMSTSGSSSSLRLAASARSPSSRAPSLAPSSASRRGSATGAAPRLATSPSPAQPLQAQRSVVAAAASPRTGASSSSSSAAESRLRGVASTASLRQAAAADRSRPAPGAAASPPRSAAQASSPAALVSQTAPAASSTASEPSAAPASGGESSARAAPAAAASGSAAPRSSSTDSAASASSVASPSKRPLSPPHSPHEAQRAAVRRRTWWGLGPEEEVPAPAATTSATPAAAKPDEVDSGDAGQSTASPSQRPNRSAKVTTASDEPPPPMNADEAAFRERLMRDAGASTSSSAASPSTLDPSSGPRLPSVAKQQADAAPASRRSSWFGWGGVHDALPSAAAPTAEKPEVRAEEKPEPKAEPKAEPKQEPKLEAPSAAPASAAPPARAPPSASAAANRRSWLAPRNVSDPQSGSAYAAVASPLRRVWGASSSSSVAASDGGETTPMDEDPPAQGSEPSAVPPPEQQAAGWGWSLWGSRAVSAPQPQAAEPSSPPVAPTPPAQEGPAPAAPASEATPMDEDPPAVEPQPTPGYLARWLPSWGSPAAATPAAEPASAAPAVPAAPPPTPAEQVKAAALARPAPLPSPTVEVEARNAVINPATRSGWVSYFSSKGAKSAAHRVEDRPEGPEVMEVDVGPSAPPPAQQLSGKKAPAASIASAATEPAQPLSKAAKTLANKASTASLRAVKPVAPASKAGKPPVEGPPMDAPRPDPAPPSSRPLTPMGRVASKPGDASGPSSKPGSVRLPPPNLILPSFEDTFLRPPRSHPPLPSGVLGRTLSVMSAWAGGRKAAPTSTSSTASRIRKSSSIMEAGPAALLRKEASASENRLPRTWGVMGNRERERTRGCKENERVVVIGVHGWFSQGPLAKIFGEPTGTSVKLASMMSDAVRRQYTAAGLAPPEGGRLTVIPLQGDGKVGDRVDRLYAALLAKQEWVEAVKQADVLFVAAHSQGCIVATHLLARLIEQDALLAPRARITLLAVAGIHHGPFGSLRSGISHYYLNAFESPAASQLFEFSSSNSACSQQYAAAQRIVLAAGAKVVYVASVDDQVVPLYSALNASTSHPSILRALYVDSQAFPRVDFLTNLLAFCVTVRNAGLPDHGLLSLLSASVAGSLYAGEGHSKCYEEPATYDLATRYAWETTSPLREPTTRADEAGPPKGVFESFEAQQRWNPYSLPWALRGILEDAAVRDLYHRDIAKLLRDYSAWTPSTKTLKDVQWRLEPMRSIPVPPEEEEPDAAAPRSSASSVSKL